MKKVLLAIDNKYIFENIKGIKKYDVFPRDIVYKEGILDVIKKENIDVVIINKNICGQIEFKKLIENIIYIKKDIKIVVYLSETDFKYINFLNSNGIYSVHNLKMLSKESVLEILEKEFFEEKQISNEIKLLKKIIKIDSVKKRAKDNKTEKVIILSGEKNVGKTMFSTTIAQIVENLKEKVILISFDDEKKDVELLINKIIKVNKIETISEFFDVAIFSKESEINIEQIKNKYEFIIIDLSYNEKFERIKYAFINPQKLIFLIEPSILGINKARNLLDFYINEIKIDVDEIEIVFNRVDNKSIPKDILEEIFNTYNVLGFCKNGKLKEFTNKVIKRRVIYEL